MGWKVCNGHSWTEDYMTSPYIPITRPSITDLEINCVNGAIRNGWGSNCYDYIYRFQDKFAEYIGVEHAIATSSCTGAIHLALSALDLQPGDEVIVPEINWIASIAPITYLGGKPVFVDVLSDTWCIDPEKIKSAITKRTKGIIPVHIYGNLAEMDQINEIAGKHNLFVIEDSAEAIGSEYKNKKAGTISDVGVFSFHGTKTMTTGEGGMLVTDNPSLFEKISFLADHGRRKEEKKQFYPHHIGYKYKMSNLQAALGYAQISRIEELVSKKREIFSWYKELSSPIQCSYNYEQPYCKNSYWMPTLLFNNKENVNRDNLIVKLREKKIDTRPFFYPLSALPPFKEQREHSIAYSLYERGLNLPSYYDLSLNTVKTIINEIRAIIGLLP